MDLNTKNVGIIAFLGVLLIASAISSCHSAQPNRKEVMSKIQDAQRSPTTPENLQQRSRDIKQLIRLLAQKEGREAVEQIVSRELKQKFEKAMYSNDYDTACQLADEIIGNLAEFAKTVEGRGEPKKLITDYQDSPFGIFAAFDLEFSQFMKDMKFSHEDYWKWSGRHFRDLGAKWSRQNVLFVWGFVEPELGKGYIWEGRRNKCKANSILKTAYQQGGDNFNMVAVIEANRKKHGIGLKGNEEHFKRFVRATVERYNGDGINDYDQGIRVKYWQASNEVLIEWFNRGGTVEGYVSFLRLLSKEIRSVDPEAKIILGGEIAERNQRLTKNIKAIISGLNGEKVFDVVDIHYWNRTDQYKMTIAREMRALLDRYGYNEVEIWSMEHGTYTNQPIDRRKRPLSFQSEKEQALFLIRSYVYNLANDVDKIFWNNLMEWNGMQGRRGGIFDNMGLISDGRNSGETLSTLAVPRLSYYTYKKMVEVLEGSDWDKIQKIQESGDIYIYKFTKDNKPIYAAWNDNPREKQVTISGIESEQVKITEVVPERPSGADVKDYNTVFKSSTRSVEGGKINILLRNIPIFIEEAQ